MRPTEGFTLIEVLVAITLLSVIIVVVVASLTVSFRLSGSTTLQSVATNRAQATLEAVRGQWQQDLNRYDTTCVVYTLPAGTTASVQNETASGDLVGTAQNITFAASCPTPTASPTAIPLRRVTVTANNTSGNSGGQSVLILEIARP
ncbi:prepilin-type N-terminal cleavage/methylation domain-containing protein [uncultured Deinococcus sp.]|uniref:type IV pilus modification PilV family protein n=1 Tax=uncultured Deinococcus sp. TaxID=158789 RepID=UPI0037493D9E